MKIEGFVTRAQAGLVKPLSVSRNITPENGGFTVHHAGNSQQIFSHADCIRRWRGYQTVHMRNSYHDIAYNVGWCQHGYVFAGRGAGVRSGANGTNVGNQNYYGGCWIGGLGDTPTKEAIQALEWLINSYRATGGAGKRVVPHSFHKATQCPGPWHSLIGKYDNREIVKETPPPPAQSWEDRLMAKLPTLRRRTNLGVVNEWDRRLQGLLAAAGTLAIAPNLDRNNRFDGKFGPSTETAVRNFQQSARIGVDGIVGPQTWTKLLGN